MSRLMVIVVPPAAQPNNEGYSVILGDCVLPGFTLWQGWDVEEANRQCASLAEHYQLQGYPFIDRDLTEPRRAMLRLIKGGAS